MKKLCTLFLMTSIVINTTYTPPHQKEYVLAYHETGEYGRDLENIVADVMATFNEPASSPKKAVIFDIDEVALSNYFIFKEHDFCPDIPTWSHALRANPLPAIKPLLRLYHYFKNLNYTIIFLTRRSDALREITEQNLAHEGYTLYDRLIMYTTNHEVPKNRSFKEHERMKLSQEGYEIVCTIDDQERNLEGECVGYAVKIPNTLYAPHH